MTGAKQIMQAQAVNNHNIANINTVGFRADAVSFVSQPIYGPGYATRVNAVASDAGTDYSTGVMQSTGRELDVSVNGKGYIAVLGLDGKEAYTRAGDLRVSAEGAVTTASGLPVLTEQGPLNVPPATTITIGSDGTVSVVPLGLLRARSRKPTWSSWSIRPRKICRRAMTACCGSKTAARRRPTRP